MKKLLLLLITGIFPILTYSQEGFEYAITGNDVDYYYKMERDVAGYYKDIWLKYDNPVKKVKTKSGKFVTTGGGYTMAYMTINCPSKSHETKNILVYNSKGNVIKRDDTPTFSRPIVPGSVIEAIYKKACAKD